MAWNVELTWMVRILIGDIDSPQKYTDEYIQRVIVTSAMIVDAEVSFAYDYTYNIEDITISPDPVELNDSVFIALVPLKAACLITQGEFKQAIGQGIKVRDGDSAIDTSVSFKGYSDILKYGPCASYESLKWTLQASGATTGGGVGQAVLGPNRAPGQRGFNSISWYYDQFAINRTGRRYRP